ncbi:unnamed protein product [Ambrosiozyma monospora]|uniref:Unnamed protein product n=1 Tax=Ambrosiozyma monospora TaxID=43982 RepID=A0A9W7DF33_AMBMO|nr:unnamed protein product [Ambrosiozyma monospora]
MITANPCLTTLRPALVGRVKSFSCQLHHRHFNTTSPNFQQSSPKDQQQNTHTTVNSRRQLQHDSVLAQIRKFEHLTPQQLDRKGHKTVNVEDKLNATETLPQWQILVSKKMILKDLVDEVEKKGKTVYKKRNGKLKFSKWAVLQYRWLKNYLLFFKLGITNVWNTHRYVKKNIYHGQLYIVDTSLNASDRIFKSKKVAVRKSNLDTVLDEAANGVRLAENECIVKNVGFWNGLQGQQNKDDVHDGLIALTRSNFQRIIRERRDWIRLPLFALLFALLEEVTVLFYFVIPTFMPTTCVFPNFSRWLFAKAEIAQLNLQVLGRGGDANINLKDVSHKNPYTMDSTELRQVCDMLLIEKGIPLFATDDSLREKLLKRYKEILIDDYLILRDGGVNQLNKLELFDACTKRGLIDYQEILASLNVVEDAKFFDNLNEEKMRNLLTRFIVDFAKRENNVGLLGAYTTVDQLVERKLVISK